MATEPRKGKPFVWISWVTGIVAGKQQCEYPAWFRSHFKAPELAGHFDLDRWTAEHNALVDLRKREFEAEGHAVRVENENWLRVVGETAILCGKPDLNARLGGQFTLADGKTGNQSPKDWWQMLAYLYMLPKAWKNDGLRVTGEVFYGRPNELGDMRVTDRIVVHPEEFDSARRAQFFAVVRRAGDPTPPKKVPSRGDCRNCNLVDCAERAVGYQSEDEIAAPDTAEF